MSQAEHWERIYAATPAEKLGWYKPRLQPSLAWIHDLGLPPEAPIIDVGGGASTLVDDLLEAGHRDLTVLDFSERALGLAKSRLGASAGSVTWLHADVLQAGLPAAHYALWHDRAVFHFLTAPEERQAYREAMLAALQSDGHVIMATFAPEAPPKCSGLPVERYSPEQLEEALGAAFDLLRSDKELHVTPAGLQQMYLYCLFRKATA